MAQADVIISQNHIHTSRRRASIIAGYGVSTRFHNACESGTRAARLGGQKKF